MNQSSPGGLVLGRIAMSILIWFIWALLVLVLPPAYLEAPPSYYPMRKVREDLRTLRVALECYAIDYNAYPWPAPRLQEVGNEEESQVAFWVPNILTSPIQYIQSLPTDEMARKFHTSDRSEAYIFLTPDYLRSVKGKRIEVPGYQGRF